MLGTIIGDVAGSIYEPKHCHIKTKDFPLFTPDSRVTDDTVMSCAVAEALFSYIDSKNINLFKKNWSAVCKSSDGSIRMPAMVMLLEFG